MNSSENLVLPLSLQSAVEKTLATRVQQVTLLSGGMINRAARVATDDGLLFLKWKANAPKGFFESEARGLELLRAADALRVPHVVKWHDAPANERFAHHDEPTPSWLALEWFESTVMHDEETFAREFAQGLAAQHRVTASRYGDEAGRSNYLGEFPQDNTPRRSWAEFWRDCRLLPLVARGLKDELLSPEYHAMLERVIDLAQDLLDACDPQPALLHGDLWSGNYLPVRDANRRTYCVLVDPAAYFGSREMELAYIELFGGFPQGFMDFYHAAYPLLGGYEQRRPLLQIYPLLMHYLHFGAEYGPPLERACAQALDT